MDQVRHSELLALEDVGRARIVAAITSDTAVLTQASNMLAFTVQGAVLIVFVAIYVAFLSIAAILTTIVVVSIAAVIFHQKNRRLVSGETEGGRMGAPAVRPPHRLPRWVQGSAA